jgi:hypothetical protein
VLGEMSCTHGAAGSTRQHLGLEAEGHRGPSGWRGCSLGRPQGVSPWLHRWRARGDRSPLPLNWGSEERQRDVPGNSLARLGGLRGGAPPEVDQQTLGR